MQTFLIRNAINGLVLEPGADPGNQELPLHSARADGSSRQLWTYEAGGFITHVDTGLVMDIFQANQDEDTPIIVGRRNTNLPVDARSNQQWDLAEDGVFVSRFNAFKLDIASRNAADSPIVAHSDRDGLHERQAWTRWYGQA